jgi:hypothetical protein
MLAGVSGIIVPDHWKPYYAIQGVKHALCNAHHLCELQAWSKSSMRIGRFDAILADGTAFHEGQPALAIKRNRDGKPRGGLPPRRIGHNLLLRLGGRKQDVLRFLNQLRRSVHQQESPAASDRPGRQRLRRHPNDDWNRQEERLGCHPEPPSRPPKIWSRVSPQPERDWPNPTASQVSFFSRHRGCTAARAARQMSDQGDN